MGACGVPGPSHLTGDGKGNGKEARPRREAWLQTVDKTALPYHVGRRHRRGLPCLPFRQASSLLQPLLPVPWRLRPPLLRPRCRMWMGQQYKDTYSERTVYERVNNRILNDYCLQHLKICGKDHFSFWSMLIGICIHLDARYKAAQMYTA